MKLNTLKTEAEGGWTSTNQKGAAHGMLYQEGLMQFLDIETGEPVKQGGEGWGRLSIVEVNLRRMHTDWMFPFFKVF